MKISITALLMLLVIFCGPASADMDLPPIPGAKKYVNSFNNDPEIKKTNWLELKKKNDREYVFNLMTERREHYCTLAGTAKVASPRVLFFRDGNCKLKFEISKNKVRVVDVADQCKPAYCGFNAGFGDETYVQDKQP